MAAAVDLLLPHLAVIAAHCADPLQYHHHQIHQSTHVRFRFHFAPPHPLPPLVLAPAPPQCIGHHCRPQKQALLQSPSRSCSTGNKRARFLLLDEESPASPTTCRGRRLVPSTSMPPNMFYAVFQFILMALQFYIHNWTCKLMLMAIVMVMASIVQVYKIREENANPGKGQSFQTQDELPWKMLIL